MEGHATTVEGHIFRKFKPDVSRHQGYSYHKTHSTTEHHVGRRSAKTSEPADGYEFVEVKPGRVLRVRHVIPEREVEEEPSGPGGSVHCKRKITVYRNGQLLIENLGDAVRQELLHAPNGEAEPNCTVEVELGDPPSNPTPNPDPKVDKTGSVVGTGGSGARGAATAPAPTLGLAPDLTQQLRKRRRKPKRTVVIDSERKITSCKGTHADVALFFVHGVGGSLDIWGSQLDFFFRLGYEVIAPDLAGHGASLAPQIAAAYTFYALAEDMRAIFKRYARKRNILIGHSYGVSFCTFLAHEYPDQVHKVVMINGGGPTALEPSLCSIFNLPTCVLHCLSPCLSWSFLKAGFAHQGAKEKQLLKDNNAFNVSSFVLRAMMSGQYWPEGDEVYHAEITVPILLVHGIVNTLLHEFFLWEPDSPPKSKPRPEITAKRPETAKTPTASNGGATSESQAKNK
ncbi:unnamed protein product [Coregonus sp. 'balchen']|nr:unnamed protein product [Coregonus sp. 'balchen']